MRRLAGTYMRQRRHFMAHWVETVKAFRTHYGLVFQGAGQIPVARRSADPSRTFHLTACRTFGQILDARFKSGFDQASPDFAMRFLRYQREWWFCQKPDCSSSDRIYGLEAQSLAELWLHELRDDPFRILAFRDLVRSNISLPGVRVDAMLVQRIEEMLISGRLHLHKKKREVQSGSGVQKKNVPFPLSERQPRDTSPPPPVIDPPSFSSQVNLSAQAAALVAAAGSGTPFCLECTNN
jgi:hypothetical protein